MFIGLNQVLLMGYVTKKPTMGTTIYGSPQARIVIAINYETNDKSHPQKTYFIPVYAFDKQALHVEKYVTKGMVVTIIGEIHTYIPRKSRIRWSNMIISAKMIKFAQARGKNVYIEVPKLVSEQQSYPITEIPPLPTTTLAKTKLPEYTQAHNEGNIGDTVIILPGEDNKERKIKIKEKVKQKEIIDEDKEIKDEVWKEI